jgi:starch-binding outer membrane protein, SusD/RagB family
LDFKNNAMQQRNFLSIYTGLLLLLLTNSGCKKFVEVDLPSTLVQTQTVFSNDATAEAAVIGIYSQLNILNLSMANGGASVYGGLLADDIYATSSSSSAAAFSNNSLLPDNSIVSTNFWALCYKCIYQCNLVLEGLHQSSILTDSVQQRLEGEVKCLRGFFYLNLVNFFGDVPLQTSSDFEVNAVKTRGSVADVYTQIKTDLQDAKQLLKANDYANNTGRAGKWVASSLLARAYLYTGDWTHAEAEASEVIQSGYYNIVTDINSVFPGHSAEMIWQLIKDNVNTSEGSSFVPSSSTARPAYALTSYLLAAFEPNDKRRTNWVKSNTVSSVVYYFPYKYKVRSSTTVTEYSCLLRLAELYLSRAEARAHLNETDSAAADINVIRNRAGLPNTTAVTIDELVAAIQQERRVEFFAECGQRWFDLKRTGKADEVLSIVKGSNWTSTDALLPIPQQSLDSNPFLTQNPGY